MSSERSLVYDVARGLFVVEPLDRFHITGRIETVRRGGEEATVIYVPSIYVENIRLPVIPYKTIEGCLKDALVRYTIAAMPVTDRMIETAKRMIESSQTLRALVKRGDKEEIMNLLASDPDLRRDVLLKMNPKLGLLCTLKIPPIRAFLRDWDMKIKILLNPFLSTYSCGLIIKRAISYSNALPVCESLASVPLVRSRLEYLHRFNTMLRAEKIEEIRVPSTVAGFFETVIERRAEIRVDETIRSEVLSYFKQQLGLSDQEVKDMPFLKPVIWEKEYVVTSAPFVAFVMKKITSPITAEHLGAVVASVVSLDVMGREVNRFRAHLMLEIQDFRDLSKPKLLYVMKDNTAKGRFVMNEFARQCLEAYLKYVTRNEFVKELEEIADVLLSKQ